MRLRHWLTRQVRRAGIRCYRPVLTVLEDRTLLSFITAQSYPVGSGPSSVAVGDFNGDGIPDLAVANNGDGTVSILLGKGDGTFQGARNYPVGSNPDSVAVGDFNGDGHLDLAVADQGSNSVSILLGNGDGTFQTAHNYTAGSDPVSVAVGDFNGDGHLDLAVANQNSGTVSVLLGNGDGSFHPMQSYNVFASSVAVGDFNGDGKLDLAVTNSGPEGHVSILLGNGDGTFQGARNYDVGVNANPESVTVGDFNGDGKLDLAMVSNFSTVIILLGKGNGSFQPAQTYAVPNVSSVTVADLNGDGHLDLVVADAGSSSVSILLGKGDGTFQTGPSYPAGSNPASVAVGDFNGDGHLDVALADQGSNTVSVLLGNGDGSFQGAPSYAAGANPQSLAVGDFNGDGIPDLAVANSGSNTVSVLLGNADGTFQPAHSYTVASGVNSVAVGDFNGDGHLDLAVTSSNGGNPPLGTLSILLGNGDGTFQAAQSFGDGFGAHFVAVGDFNGDGKEDIVTANVAQLLDIEGLFTIEDDVRVLLGNGDGTFQAAQSYAVGYEPQSVAVGDFNGDGKLDLAVADQDGGVSILLGNGDGTFHLARSLAASARSLAVGDFNGDGKLDLAVATGSDTVSVLLGNGDGSFQSARNYAVGSGPDSVAVGDFNGDGHLDLAVANESGTVSVLLGNGDGSFQPAQSYAAGASDSAAVGDFNGDGYPDLAAANATGGVTVLLNAGDWWPAVSLAVHAPAEGSAGTPFAVTVTALDQYGQVVKNYTGTVSFSSSDPYPGMLPAGYTFTPSDHGSHTFAGVTFYTAGTQTLTAQDMADNAIAGSAPVTVSAAPASQLLIAAPPTTVAGVAFDLVVTAEDPYGNVVTNYMGTVTFTSSDPYPGIVPADYTFQSSDEGGHPFAGLALFTAGVQMLTVQDTINAALTGTAALSVTPAAASHFLLAAPTMVLSSMPFDVTVTALDPYGNVDTNYAGTVTLSSTDSDPGVVLPPAYTFQASDAGTHAFPDGVTLITLGDQSLTVTDTVSGIAGSAAITVTGGGGGAASPPGGGRVRPSAPSMTADRTPTGSVQPGPQLAVVDRLFSVLEREKFSIAAQVGKRYRPGKQDGWLLDFFQPDFSGSWL